MTAYGQATVDLPFGQISLEIQSVNRKHLEIITFLPTEFVALDVELKKWVSQAVTRGHISIKVHVLFHEDSGSTILPNMGVVKKFKSAKKKLQEVLNLPEDDQFLLQLVARNHELFIYKKSVENLSFYRDGLHQAFLLALDPFMQMKTVEGNFLAQDIQNRMHQLELHLLQIEQDSSTLVDRYRQKLQEKVKQILPDLADNEERLLREIILYAEKVNIAEEIVRFRSHFIQLASLLTSGLTAVAKTTEFLLQELFREANTISSKSPDTAITHHTIAIKSELEKIKEQIQNIE